LCILNQLSSLNNCKNTISCIWVKYWDHTKTGAEYLYAKAVWLVKSWSTKGTVPRDARWAGNRLASRWPISVNWLGSKGCQMNCEVSDWFNLSH
jgi:hypothetical protein